MTPLDTARQLRALRLIAADMESDAAALEGAPFDGPTVAPVLGQLMAAIAALAKVMAAHIEEQS